MIRLEKIDAKVLTDGDNIFIYSNGKITKVDLTISNSKFIDLMREDLKKIPFYKESLDKFIIIDNINKNPYTTDKKKKLPKEGSITEQISDFINSYKGDATITKLYNRFKEKTGENCSYTLFYKIYQRITHNEII